MALSFNLNLSSKGNTTSHDNNNVETAGSLASNETETAGSLACASSSGNLLSNNNGQIDQFVSSNPFAPQIDYSQFASVETAGSLASTGIETAGSLAFSGAETAGSLAFSGVETAGSIAFSGAETAGSVASNDSSSSFSSFC